MSTGMPTSVSGSPFSPEPVSSPFFGASAGVHVSIACSRGWHVTLNSTQQTVRRGLCACGHLSLANCFGLIGIPGASLTQSLLLSRMRQTYVLLCRVYASSTVVSPAAALLQSMKAPHCWELQLGKKFQESL